MIESLRDPIWQFIGAILTLLTLLSGFLLFYIKKTRKELHCQVLSWVQLTSVDDNLSKKVKILYENQPVDNVSLIEFVIANTGNTSILPLDFESHFAIDFDSVIRLLSVNIYGEFPNDLNVQIHFTQSQIAFEPLLLNQGDYFFIKVLADNPGNFRRDVSYSGRIVGMSGSKRKPNRLLSALLTFAGLLFVMFGFIGFFIYSFPFKQLDQILQSLPFVILLIVGYLISFRRELAHKPAWLVAYEKNISV